jgi:hypothetical protein
MDQDKIHRPIQTKENGRENPDKNCARTKTEETHQHSIDPARRKMLIGGAATMAVTGLSGSASATSSKDVNASASHQTKPRRTSDEHHHN